MPEKEHRHKHKASGGGAKKSSRPKTGVYTGRTEEVPLLDGGGDAGAAGGCACCAGGVSRKNVVFAVVFVVVVVAVALCAVFLSLPATYTCDAKEGSYYIKVVEPPAIARADPPVVCAAHATPLTLHGTTFVTHPSSGALPAVRVELSSADVRAADVRLAGLNASDCASLRVRRRDYRACAALGMTATFPRHPAAESYTATFDVTNPAGPRAALGRVANGTCRTAARVVTVIPSPAVAAVAPGFLCRGGANAVTLSGSYFVQARRAGAPADSVPSFALCGAAAAPVARVDACTDLPAAAGYDYIRSCGVVVAETDAAACTPGAVAALALTNPAPGACPAEYPDALRLPVTAPPAVDAVEPALVCAAGGHATVALRGSGFVTVDGAPPAVQLDGTDAPSVAADECTPHTVGETTVALCTRLTVGVPDDAGTGADDVRAVALAVAAPDGSTCGARFANAVFYMPPPVVDSVEPAVLCHADVAQNVSLHGKFVAEQATSGGGDDDDDDDAFTVEIGPDATPAPATYLADCTEETVGGRVFRACATLVFEVPPETPYGPLALTVRGTCETAVAAERFAHVPAPNVTGMSQRTVCRSALNVVTLTGAAFVATAGRTVLPRVVLGDEGVEVSDVGVDDCAPVRADAPDFELCAVLRFTVNGAAFAAGATPALTVSNTAGGCGPAHVVAAMPVADAPTVADYGRALCAGADAAVRVTGAGFRAGAAEFLLRADDGTLLAANVSDVSATAFTASFAAGTVAPGTYHAVVRSAPQAECTATGTETPVAVHRNDLALLAVAPAAVVAPGGRRAQTVVLTARALDALPAALVLRSAARTLVYTPANLTALDGDPTRLALALPTDVAAGESFNATLHAQTTCRTTRDALLAVLAETPTGTLSVAPRVVSAQADTLVTITVDTGNRDSTAFTADDVLDVTATSTDASDTAVHVLEDVRVVGAAQVAARVGAGALAAGTYTVHVTRAATGEHWAHDIDLTVLAAAPPRIDSVTPSLVDPRGTTQLHVRGAHFGAGVTTRAELRCRGGVVVPLAAPSVLGADELVLTVQAAPADHTACAVVVTGDDGALPATFGGLTLASDRTRPNWHLAKFAHGVCGASAVTARAGTRDFVYVLGGDRDAACAGAAPTADAHFAAVDAAGDGLPTGRAWTATSALPTALAFAQAQVVGTYVYVLGGHSGVGALRTVHRAQVLQPADAPRLRSALRGALAGRLAPGHYLYAVTAVYRADDTHNPGGESLASNVAAVNVPAETAVPHLTWDALADPGVAAYRVYRAPLPDPANSTATEPAFALLAEVSKPEYDDLGSAEPDATRTPPPVGALGRWAVLGDQPLPTPRCAHAAAASTAAGAAGHHFLFAFGGTDGAPEATGAALDSYESTLVAVTAGDGAGVREQHQVSAWRNGTARVRGQRFGSAVTLDSSNAGYRGMQAFVLGPGTAGAAHQVNYAENSDTLLADTFAATELPDFAYFGYCLFAHGDTLVAVGGSADAATLAPADKNAHAMALNTTDTRPPTPLTEYTQLPDGPLVGTVFPACTRVGGYLAIIGGRDDDGNLLDSVQYVAG